MDRFILIKKRTKRSLAGKVSYDETCTPGFESSTQGFIPGLVLFFQLLAKKAQCAPSQLVSVTHKKASNLFVPPSCLGRRHFYLKLVQAGVIQKLFRQYCQLMHQYFRGFKLCTPIIYRRSINSRHTCYTYLGPEVKAYMHAQTERSEA